MPINYVTPGHEYTELLWLSEHEHNRTFALPASDANPAWLKLNINMTGYYRVCYDTATWDALIHQLETDHTVEFSLQCMLVYTSQRYYVVKLLLYLAASLVKEVNHDR